MSFRRKLSCCFMGGARIIYKRRILSVEAVDADQSLCTRYTKITVASPTAPAPPVFSGEVKGITPNVTYPMIVASPAVDVPTVLAVSLGSKTDNLLMLLQMLVCCGTRL